MQCNVPPIEKNAQQYNINNFVLAPKKNIFPKCTDCVVGKILISIKIFHQPVVVVCTRVCYYMIHHSPSWSSLASTH